jgi:hypothetical protein
MVSGLERDRDYIPRVWIKSKYLEPKGLFITLNHKWQKPVCYARAGKQDWYELVCDPVNTGSSDFLDLRFVFQAPGKVWLGNISLTER